MVERAELQAYLARVLRRPVELLGVRPLKSGLGEEGDPKAFGYGVPLEVECLVGGEPRQFVLAQIRPEAGFGHEYPA
ncbi:MAG: aminoglycoside phosphotransferase family protein, partial [Candidatus Rokubacteria bacterium]|nr:aminoglycoside phosphotransferase family protein [Candidatus Rokubacteria bacterium]